MTLRTSVCALSVVLVGLLACKKKHDPTPKAAASVAPAPAASAATAPAQAAPAPSATPALSARNAAPDVNDKGVPAIPTGHSNPPTPAEWKTGVVVNTQGANSQAQDCSMKIVREWIRVHCEGDIKSISDKKNLPRSSADYYESVKLGKYADFVFRLKKGRTTSLRIHRDGDRASLFINWPASKDRPVNVALAQIQE